MGTQDSSLTKRSYEQVRDSAENCILSAMKEYSVPNDPQLFAAFFAVYVYNFNFIKLKYTIYEGATSSVKEKFIVDVSAQMKQAIQDPKDPLLKMSEVLRVIIDAGSAYLVENNSANAAMETRLFVKDLDYDCKHSPNKSRKAIFDEMTAKKAYEMQSDNMYQSR